MANKPWTKEEIALLCEKKKVPNRSKKSIRRKSIELGLRTPKYKIKFHNKKPWTKEELYLLAQNKKIPGRSAQSIRSKKYSLGFSKNPSRKPWKKTQEKLLIKLVGQKHTAKSIFEMNVLPYSRNSIQKKMCSLGITNKGPVRKVLSKEDSKKLKNFLVENWQGKTPEELVNLWNLNNKFKINKGKVLYYLYSLKIKIPFGEVLKINFLRKKEQLIKNNFYKSAKLFEEDLRKNRKNIMKERLLQGKDIWTGLPLTGA